MPEIASYDYNTGFMPRYKEPVFDWSRVGGLQQEQMASPLAESRRELRNIRAMSYANPMEMEEAYRGGMRGYGESIGNIQAGGMRSALGMYGEELSGKRRQAQADYDRALMEWKLKEKERQEKGTALGLTGAGGTSTALPRLPTVYSSGYSMPLTNKFAGTTTGAGQPTGYFGGPVQNYETVYGAGSEEAYKKAMREAELARIAATSGGYSGTATTSGWSI